MQDTAEELRTALRRLTTGTIAPAHVRSACAIVRAISAGDSGTFTPAPRSASSFSRALPRPPAMIAPACPMRRPAGAVVPAM